MLLTIQSLPVRNTNGHVTLVVITGTTIPVPSKSSHWNSFEYSTHGFHLWMFIFKRVSLTAFLRTANPYKLQTSCWDLKMWQGTRIISSAMAANKHFLLITVLKKIIIYQSYLTLSNIPIWHYFYIADMGIDHYCNLNKISAIFWQLGIGSENGLVQISHKLSQWRPRSEK